NAFACWIAARNVHTSGGLGLTLHPPSSAKSSSSPSELTSNSAAWTEGVGTDANSAAHANIATATRSENRRQPGRWQREATPFASIRVTRSSPIPCAPTSLVELRRAAV